MSISTFFAAMLCVALLKIPASQGDTRPGNAPGAEDASICVQTNGYSVTFDWEKAKDMEKWTKERLAPAICEWAPKIADLLASDGWTPPKAVSFKFVKTNREYPAWASGASVSLNSGWYRTELDGEALGAAIHELVHVMQDYWGRPRRGQGTCPSWCVEGIADYIRWFLFEPESDGCGYLRRCDLRKVHYNDAYRTTASFLDFVERTYPGTVKKLNAELREREFRNEEFWKKTTGKTAEELEADWKAELEKAKAAK